MTEGIKRSLLDFVVSEGRVWPYKWQEFYALVGRDMPGFPPPLILGGAMESDATKRQRLIDQINYISTEPNRLERANLFLRGLTLEDWYRSGEPLSTDDAWPFRFPGEYAVNEAAVRPSRDQVRTALQDLRENWVETVGVELASVTEPVRFTGKKMRRLLVEAKNDHTPPWGAWDRVSANPGSFTAFRASINARLSPLHVDHICFRVQARARSKT